VIFFYRFRFSGTPVPGNPSSFGWGRSLVRGCALSPFSINSQLFSFFFEFLPCNPFIFISGTSLSHPFPPHPERLCAHRARDSRRLARAILLYTHQHKTPVQPTHTNTIRYGLMDRRLNQARITRIPFRCAPARTAPWNFRMDCEVLRLRQKKRKVPTRDGICNLEYNIKWNKCDICQLINLIRPRRVAPADPTRAGVSH